MAALLTACGSQVPVGDVTLAERWTRQFGTTSDDSASGVATDAAGNLYVAGLTSGDLDGANEGNGDAFIRSYDANGNVRWTRQFGTTAYENVYGIATDANGNVYATGQTDGVLGGAQEGFGDAFIRSYDADGNVRWTRQFGTTQFETAYGIATDADGNVYATGYTNGGLDGAQEGLGDAFIRSYDVDGNLRWTRQFGTTALDLAIGVATDADGYVYIVGHTYGDLDGTNEGDRDAFTRSYDGDGNVRWTRLYGATEYDGASGVATDAAGNVYVTAYTYGVGDGDAVVVSYDAAGDLRWTWLFGTAQEEEPSGIATDGDNSVYVAGYTLGDLDGTNAGGVDAFVSSYGP